MVPPPQTRMYCSTERNTKRFTKLRTTTGHCCKYSHKWKIAQGRWEHRALSEGRHLSSTFSGTFQLRLYCGKSPFFRGIYSANQKLLSSFLINVTMYAGPHIAARPFPAKDLSMTRIRRQTANSLATDQHRDI